MDVYSERLSRLVEHIPPEMLPFLPDVVVECIRLHAALPGASLRNRSEAAFLRWMCSQIESLIAKKAHSREGKGLDHRPRRHQETLRERKGAYATNRHEQNSVTPPHVRHSPEETKELIRERADKTKGNNRKSLTSHIHQSLNETEDSNEADNHHMQDSPLETKGQRRERKGLDERNGSNHKHLSVKVKESIRVEDTNGKKRKPFTYHTSDSFSETEDFMEVDKTNGNYQQPPESYMHDTLNDTREFIDVENTNGNNGKSPTSNTHDDREETMEPLKNTKRNQPLASHMHDDLDERKEVRRHKTTFGNNHFVSQMGEKLQETKKKQNGNNRCASHMGDNLEEMKEPKRIQNLNRNNCIASHMGDSLKDAMDLKRAENTNRNNHKAHESHIHDSLRESKDFMRERKGVERRNRNHHTHRDTVKLIAADKTRATHRNHLASHTYDSLRETKDLMRERKGVDQRNGNNHFPDTFKETKNGNHRKPAPSYARDNLKETKELTRVDKTNANQRKPAQSNMHDILKETKDKTVDQTSGNHRKSTPPHMQKSLKESKEMQERVEICASRKDDDGCETKKQCRGPGRSDPSPRRNHSREKTPKRKHRKSPEIVSTDRCPSYPMKSVFTYLSLIETDSEGTPNTRYDWTPTSSISHRTTPNTKEPSHSKGSKRATKDWKTVGSYTYQNLKTDKTMFERLGAGRRLVYDRKSVYGSCVNVTKFKDKMRNSWKPVGPYQKTKNVPKHVQFLLESVRA